MWGDSVWWAGRKWEDVKGRVQGRSGAYTTERLARQRNSAPQLMMAVRPCMERPGTADQERRQQQCFTHGAMAGSGGLLCSERVGASAVLSFVRELG